LDVSVPIGHRLDYRYFSIDALRYGRTSLRENDVEQYSDVALYVLCKVPESLELTFKSGNNPLNEEGLSLLDLARSELEEVKERFLVQIGKIKWLIELRQGLQAINMPRLHIFPLVSQDPIEPIDLPSFTRFDLGANGELFATLIHALVKLLDDVEWIGYFNGLWNILLAAERIGPMQVL
jgi:hypothetical protein